MGEWNDGTVVILKDTLCQWYWIISNTVLFDSRLTDKQKLLYCLISSLCAEKWYCRASNKYLWEKLWAKEWTISTWIKKLINLWYLTSDVKQENGNERCIKLGNVKNHNTSCEKSQDLLWNFTNPSCENSQHNITMNITIEKLFSQYYWKTKWIDEKVCYKLIDNKLKQWSTLDDIWKWMILYNCERRLKQDRDHVMKFETWIKWYQQLDEDQTDEQIKILAKSYKEKMSINPKFVESKVAKTVWEDLCSAFGEQKIRDIWKSEWKKEISLNLK